MKDYFSYLVLILHLYIGLFFQFARTPVANLQTSIILIIVSTYYSKYSDITQVVQLSSQLLNLMCHIVALLI